MLQKYLFCFLVSMVPLIELRGGVPIAVGMGLPYLPSLLICIVGNMLPVPIIYLFARKVLEWGKDKKYIGKFFTYCIVKLINIEPGTCNLFITQSLHKSLFVNKRATSCIYNICAVFHFFYCALVRHFFHICPNQHYIFQLQIHFL